MEVREGTAVCPWCWFARDREDICGVYCTEGFTNEDGRCDRFLDYLEEKERRDSVAFKTNVVKSCWSVETVKKGGYKKKRYLFWAESEEKAKLMVPEDEEVVLVKHMDGGGPVA